jgi:predicted dienelactone hydrolase
VRTARPALTAALLALLATGAACSDDGGSDDAGSNDETTTTVAEAAGDLYAEPGEHPVGVTTLTLPSGPEVEVWYPAAEDGGGTVTYDARDFVPESIRALLTADIPAGHTIDADRDLPGAADEGPFPVVLFSHGFSGFRLQSTFLTSHLASHGFVVAAPDHPSRDLENVLGGTASGDREAAAGELLEALEQVEAESADDTSVLAGLVDGEQVATLGHSAGGGTAFLAAADPRIDGYVSMASGTSIGTGDGSEEEPEVTYPELPSFFLAGAIDGVVPPAEATRPSFEAAPSPSWYWEIAESGHNVFADFCTFGGGSGIIGVAEESGLGPLLDSQPQLRALGEDGCIEPAAPVEEAWPIITHGVTAWLLALFGTDPEPQGFDSDALSVHALEVVTEEH